MRYNLYSVSSLHQMCNLENIPVSIFMNVSPTNVCLLNTSIQLSTLKQWSATIVQSVSGCSQGSLSTTVSCRIRWPTTRACDLVHSCNRQGQGCIVGVQHWHPVTISQKCLNLAHLRLSVKPHVWI